MFIYLFFMLFGIWHDNVLSIHCSVDNISQLNGLWLRHYFPCLKWLPRNIYRHAGSKFNNRKLKLIYRLVVFLTSNENWEMPDGDRWCVSSYSRNRSYISKISYHTISRQCNNVARALEGSAMEIFFFIVQYWFFIHRW